MAKQRPSVQKTQREHQKREREQKKAQKATQKRERRLNRDQKGSSSTVREGDSATAETAVNPHNTPTIGEPGTASRA